MKENILAVFCKATEVDMNEGSLWYSCARETFSFIAKKYNIPIIQAVGVGCALSAQKSWEENVRITEFYFRGIYKHTGRQIEKCHRIIQTTSYIKILNILGGPKTKDFFRSIYTLEDKNTCCVDRHMLSVAYGRNKFTCTKKEYRDIKNTYVQIAREKNILPSVLQCQIWLAHRKLKKIKL